MDFQGLGSRLTSVRDRIRLHQARGGWTHPVRIVAVTKTHGPEAVRAALAAGLEDVGENRVQEALAKQDQLVGQDILWHFVGGLQTKKAKAVAGRFVLVHSLDSVKLARELAKRAREAGVLQGVLIEVNMGEEQKAGVPEEGLEELAREVLALNAGGLGLDLQGLMCLPPVFDSPEEAGPAFEYLRELRDDLSAKLGVALPHLSMGMTGDFEAAIAEGATIVRVGTSLFGPRPPRG